VSTCKMCEKSEPEVCVATTPMGEICSNCVQDGFRHMEPSRKKYEGITMSSHVGGWVEGARRNHKTTKAKLDEIFK